MTSSAGTNAFIVWWISASATGIAPGPVIQMTLGSSRRRCTLRRCGNRCANDRKHQRKPHTLHAARFRVWQKIARSAAGLDALRRTLSRMSDETPARLGIDAVVVGVRDDTPHVLTFATSAGPRLPSGPFEPARDRTLELAARRVLSDQAGLSEGYLEQLYTFGDRIATRAK
jgi:hypothetical protein